jgi:sugar-specific transcriptional regulator TrmB
MDLLKQIQEFGLTEIEAKIYLSLLDKKESTVLELARNTGIKRATVHFNVENLIAKGLISQTKINNKRVLYAENPENLHILLERQKSQIAKLEGDMGLLVKTLKNRAIPKMDGFTMQVKYFEGRESVKTIYSEVVRSGEVRSYANLSKLKSTFPENQELFDEALIHNPSMIVREIVDMSSVSASYAKEFVPKGNFEFKLTPRSIHLEDTDVLIYDDKVAVISLSNQISGMVMHNREYYEISKNIFDFLWDLLPANLSN